MQGLHVIQADRDQDETESRAILEAEALNGIGTYSMHRRGPKRSCQILGLRCRRWLLVGLGQEPWHSQYHLPGRDGNNTYNEDSL